MWMGDIRRAAGGVELAGELRFACTLLALALYLHRDAHRTARWDSSAVVAL